MMPSPHGRLSHSYLKQRHPKNMEIAKALWQLCSAMLIFAGYLLFFVFVAPLVTELRHSFPHGIAFSGDITCLLPSPFLREPFWRCSASGFGSL
jgi:hypothetical protein